MSTFRTCGSALLLSLPTLVPLLFAAQVVFRPCLATSELKVTFAFLIDCSATSPILLLLVHQGQIVRPPCKLTKRRTMATTRDCPMFALAYCIDTASTTLLLGFLIVTFPTIFFASHFSACEVAPVEVERA